MTDKSDERQQVGQDDVLLTEWVLGFDIQVDGEVVGAIEGEPGIIQYFTISPNAEYQNLGQAALNEFVDMSRDYGATEIVTTDLMESSIISTLEAEGFNKRIEEKGWVKEI